VKRAVALFAAGALAGILQGAAATFVPARFLPDIGLLLVLSLALTWRSTAGGLLLAAALGYVADLLSGSLIGQHALLRVLSFGVARIGSRHLSLRGPVPQAAFAAVLTAANAAGTVALTAFFGGAGGGPALMSLLPHALVNALFAPLVSAATETSLNLLGDEDAGRRLLQLEPRKL
jgi:rod shape-determining protein MreD